VLLSFGIYSAFTGGRVCQHSWDVSLLNADFVAAAQVLIYVGAVNVLILFALCW